MVERGWRGATVDIALSTNGNNPAGHVPGVFTEWPQPVSSEQIDPALLRSSYSMEHQLTSVRGLYEVLDIGVTDVVVGPAANTAGDVTGEYNIDAGDAQWLYAAYGQIGTELDIVLVDGSGNSVVNPPPDTVGHMYQPVVELQTSAELSFRVDTVTAYGGIGIAAAGRFIDIRVAVNPDGTAVAAQRQQLII